MIPEIGNFSLILALLLAITQGTLPIIGAARGIPSWIALARPVVQGQFVFVLIAFGCLGYSFVSNDFSVLNVASNSNSELPLHFRIAATWGSHEGSLLLWVLMLAGWSVAVSVFSRQLPDEMVARVLGVLGIVSVGFLLFMLFTSNPFDRLLPAAMEGSDLNPLLQDAGMVIHPPMLYMGYVGFSVAFAFAIAALLSGQLDATWARWSRPWTTVAWAFLTFGIMLGSWWAYYELGWGGWWFWDPVENASFMPWLVGTALVHSLAVTEKRGSFKSWTVLLAICTFALSLLGTFLVRSGVLTSVHAFATDPDRGVFILAFLVIVISCSLLLFAWRAPKVGLGGKFDLLSRESLLLANNLLLLVAAGSVLLGTLYPLIIDALNLGKLSVGPPYFETVFVPLMTPAIFLMGVGPIARWKQMSLPALAVRLRWAFAISVVTALIMPFFIGEWKPLVSFGLLLSFWIITTILVNLKHRLSNSGPGGLFTKLTKQSRSYYGMHLAHLGIAVFIIGVTVVNGYETEKDVRMDVGSTVTVGGYTFRFNGVNDVVGPNYKAVRGEIDVLKDGEIIRNMQPEKRTYNASGMAMTEAAIDTGIFRDLYVALGEPLAGDAWVVRVYHKPFVDWIWFGCLLMVFGGIMAVSDRRYRLPIRKKNDVAVNEDKEQPVDNKTAGSPVLITEARET
ncbi:cytochrome c-type biogenesis protein CcmF [Nitrosomonas cryotolerans]|uniref:Cytochrome c-type biogenesis protein CcmF n=1 Tax=Nitrosomonas cryotolerans ATCC 49181 TaxID=1131553 RepID=A0A1N6HXW8_9PROT|nr:heme lyase CcmF/NrfE family subunit [Nitrosomonas cryotolerans]SFP68862.1 cytochrome c-type biogenesis protein CcmF [Nitrosomonas cryotolerans]SIO24678.1 cytochrome c-type biogenesis protein CcmF [Nitrosomonas cryotolerans ATCC 49181]